MNEKRWHGFLGLALVALSPLVSPPQLVAEAAEAADPIRRTLVFRGTEREYFVYLPPGFNRNTQYWPLVVVGGGNGRTFFLSTGIAQRVAQSRFDAIVISPSVPSDDINAIRDVQSSPEDRSDLFSRQICCISAGPQNRRLS